MINLSTDQDDAGLKKADIVRGLQQTGLKAGDVVLVHSAMRTFGHVVGGAETVVDALLEVIGQRGTLVVPTFTSAQAVAEEPIIDPENDRSEMGIISETVRLRSDALKSISWGHSFAAVGPRAQVITEVDPALVAFDLRSAFGVMLALNTQILLLGVTYQCSTSHHFAEFICEVPYRQVIDMGLVKVRRKDGSIVLVSMADYVPYRGEREPDFNRLGRMLEEQGLACITAIGNCVARRYAMRDLIDIAQLEAEKDCSIFRTPEDRPDYFTPLKFGKTVVGPEMRDAGGWLANTVWCVMDESKLALPKV